MLRAFCLHNDWNDMEMKFQVKHDHNENDGSDNFKDTNGAVVVSKLFNGLFDCCLRVLIVIML